MTTTTIKREEPSSFFDVLDGRKDSVEVRLSTYLTVKESSNTICGRSSLPITGNVEVEVTANRFKRTYVLFFDNKSLSSCQRVNRSKTDKLLARFSKGRTTAELDNYIKKRLLDQKINDAICWYHGSTHSSLGGFYGHDRQRRYK